ncbi:MAG: glycoside hydrolase family 78 protein [Proteobacteria bacterium]|nr:glycoside hydrolase family 78 protein [Pseudomonadota bacterium]
MKATIRLVFLLAVLVSTYNANVFAASEAGNLRCEYLVNPIGIDAPKPRLTWLMIDDKRAAAQSAYELIVGTDSSKVGSGVGDKWTTGKVASSAMLVEYNGSPLEPFTRYFWSVKIWDATGIPSSVSVPASFETGKMKMENWRGTWITDTHDIKLKPAPYFRTEFNANKKVVSARAYIAVAGLFELYVNGAKIGNHRLDPMYTRFDRRTLYLTHDITKSLKEGKNAVGVLLGNGWYNHQSTAVWYFDEAPWRARPSFCMDIQLTYSDGSQETITSDTDWKTALSPVISNSIYTGEHVDGRLAQVGWNSPGFDDSKWKDSIPVGPPSANIVAQMLQPIRDVEVIPAKKMKKINDSHYVFDLERNISGVSQLKVSGQAGTIIRVKHGERLLADGMVDQSNIDAHYRPTDQLDPFGTDIYTLKGIGVEIFKPSFNYKGFQYVEVTSDQPVDLKLESLTGFFMHSDVAIAGHIQSSDSILNKIWKATNNSYLSNLFGYPTDCPQREKNGWTGDAHTAVETGLYNFDGITVYEKWMADHRDEQQPNGVLPAIIPTSGWGYTWANGPDWTSTIAIIPWNIYLFYGDTKVLRDCYENIRRYVDHITKISPSGLTDWGLGDWIPVKSVSSKELTSSLFYYTDASILAKTANLLGKKADSEKYNALALKIKEAINAKYLNRETGIYASGFQTELSAPLHWGIVPEVLRIKVAENLAKRVIADGKHIDVGLLGSKTILNALSANGYADLAYEVALQKTFPSWGWWIVNGATTLYENWPIDSKSDSSLNHIMLGEIGAWFYKSLGGMYTDEKQPGFKNIIFKPDFVKGLNSFEANHLGPYGMIISSWKRTGKKIEYKVTIPPNSNAELFLKGDKILEGGKALSVNESIKVIKQDNGLNELNLKSGSYLFSIK